MYDILQTGEEYLCKKRPLVLGISPGNSYYYKNDNLVNLLNFAENNSDKIKLFIPDIIVAHNYRAVGAEKPERLAYVKGNRLRNRMKKILKIPDIAEEKFSWIDWNAEVEGSRRYKENLEEILRLYNSSPEFNIDVRQTTRIALTRFMAGRNQNESVDRVDLEEGSQYILKEFAFLTSLPSLWTGFKESSFVYHTEWPVMQRFFEGKYDGAPKKHLGFVIYCANTESEQKTDVPIYTSG